MAHQTPRQEKNCLNCGTYVAGRYCQHCGQENLPPQESVLHFIFHFINDVTHFYIFIFIATLVSMAIRELTGLLNWIWIPYINYGIAFLLLFYLYKSKRNYYGQNRSKTIFKYLIFLFSFFWVIIFIFLAFFIQVFLTV